MTAPTVSNSAAQRPLTPPQTGRSQTPRPALTKRSVGVALRPMRVTPPASSGDPLGWRIAAKGELKKRGDHG